MSLNVYFRDKIKELPGFTTKPHKDGSGDQMKIDGLSIYNDNGRLYAMLGDENSVVPEKLHDYVEEFSFYGSLPQVAKRETGIYRHLSAEAELELDQYNKVPVYKVKITGKKLEDVRERLRMIKIGSDRPEDSYEGDQKGMSRLALEEKLEQTQRDLAGVEENLRQSLYVSKCFQEAHEKNLSHTDQKMSKLRSLAGKLRQEQWPWGHKSKMADEITDILDGLA